MNNFPTIGEYNQAIQKKGGSIFTTLSPIEIIPSRTLPIKVFLYGSGAYAAVFKGKKNGSLHALRCFLNAEKDVLTRYEAICNYLDNISASWKTSCEFLNDEVELKGSRYPVLKMEWVEGTLINEFVTNNLNNNKTLGDLQLKLVNISQDLESHQIGHGDLQCGNIIISGSTDLFKVNLIDYDGMYVPALKSKSSLEKGRSEFQHPKRTLRDFNSEMDRFSFWIMLTALEALKFDKELWKEVMQGGFNTLDNFLFTSQDFLSPGKTPLWQKLYDIKEPSLNFYLEKVEKFCRNEVWQVSPPQLHENASSQDNFPKTSGAIEKKTVAKNVTEWTYKPKSPNNYGINKILIESKNGEATVMTLSLLKLGTTPLELDRDLYTGRTLIITNGQQTQKLQIEDHKYKFMVEWTQDVKETQSINEIPPIIATEHSKASPPVNSASTAKMAPEELKTPVKKKSSWKIAAVLIAVFLTLGFSGYHFDLFSFPTKMAVNETTIIEEHHTTIRNLIQAEDQRNFNDIYSYYSPNLKRYWDDYYPSKNDLKTKYEYSWSHTSHSSNNILKIEKVGHRKYNVETNFTYYNRKTEDLVTTKSIVHFALDKEGKIVETYGIENIGGSIKKDERTKMSSYNSTYFKKEIRELLRAEEQRDFQKVYGYFSPKISRYWNIYNPSKTQLHKTYSDLWNITSSSKNEITEIEKVAENIYFLHTNYSYFDLKESEEVKYRSVVRFEFGDDGKITKVYGVSSERLYPEKQFYTETAKENSTYTGSRDYSGSYIYLTFIDDPGIEVPLRSSQNVNSDVIYIIPNDSKVYVINKNHETYYRVYVNGHYGYVSKHLL